MGLPFCFLELTGFFFESSLASDFSFSLALALLSRLADGGALPPALLAGF
jgi:hypothetical protein